MCENKRIYGNGKYGVSNGYINSNIVPPTIKETTIYTPNSYQGQQNGVGGYATQDLKLSSNARQDTNVSYFGIAGGSVNDVGVKDYSAAYKQTNNELKEPTLYSRINQGNTQMFNNSINMSIAKQEQDRINNRQWVPSSMPQTSYSKEMMGQTYTPMENTTNINERMNPDLLSAFKSNPYTQSLQSVA